MKKITLQPKQIRRAAKWIAKHNPNNFTVEHVTNTILEIIRLNANNNRTYVGTMGFTVIFRNGGDYIDVDVLVDPVLGTKCSSRNYVSYDSTDEMIAYLKP